MLKAFTIQLRRTTSCVSLDTQIVRSHFYRKPIYQNGNAIKLRSHEQTKCITPLSMHSYTKTLVDVYAPNEDNSNFIRKLFTAMMEYSSGLLLMLEDLNFVMSQSVN